MKDQTAMKDQLFSGTVNIIGCLSNEHELVKHIPKEFRDWNNPWCRHSMDIFFRGGNTKDWKWRSSDQQVRNQQLRCWKAALSSFETKHEDKVALVGWMLSKMLTEVPK